MRQVTAEIRRVGVDAEQPQECGIHPDAVPRIVVQHNGSESGNIIQVSLVRPVEQGGGDVPHPPCRITRVNGWSSAYRGSQASVASLGRDGILSALAGPSSASSVSSSTDKLGPVAIRPGCVCASTIPGITNRVCRSTSLASSAACSRASSSDPTKTMLSPFVTSDSAQGRSLSWV